LSDAQALIEAKAKEVHYWTSELNHKEV